MQYQVYILIFKLNTSYQTFRKPTFNIESENRLISAEIHFTVDDKQNSFLAVLQEHIQCDCLPGFVV